MNIPKIFNHPLWIGTEEVKDPQALMDSVGDDWKTYNLFSPNGDVALFFNYKKGDIVFDPLDDSNFIITKVKSRYSKIGNLKVMRSFSLEVESKIHKSPKWELYPQDFFRLEPAKSKEKIIQLWQNKIAKIKSDIIYCNKITCRCDLKKDHTAFCLQRYLRWFEFVSFDDKGMISFDRAAHVAKYPNKRIYVKYYFNNNIIYRYFL